VRRVPLLGVGPGGGVTPSLALEALRVAQGASTIIVRSSNASGETAFGRQTGVNAVKVGAFEIAVGSTADIRPRYGAEAPRRIVSAAAILEDRAPRDEIGQRAAGDRHLATDADRLAERELADEDQHGDRDHQREFDRDHATLVAPKRAGATAGVRRQATETVHSQWACSDVYE
jgi:hypothetical protein